MSAATGPAPTTPAATARAAAMAERLPVLYRGGDLVTGLLDVLAVQLEVVEEEARRVQRRHWFDTAPDLDDAAALGALLDIGPEPWQSLGEYRAWFHALRTARVRHGAVTGPALRGFVRDYVEAFEATDDLDVVPAFDAWSTEPVRRGHAFVENPREGHTASFGELGGPSPLHRATITNAGLAPSPLSLLLTGLAAGPEYVPVVADLRAGRAVAFLGAVGPGQRLWVDATDGDLVADLEGEDVTDRLRTITRLEPGRPWATSDVEVPATPLALAPGDTDLWFLPVAHFDEPGLDRVLLALADLDLRQGRWDETTFDHSLFFQDPAVVVSLLWHETRPASVQVDLDAGVLVSPAGRLDDALDDRDQLAQSLDQGVSSLAAAGVATDVRLRPLVASQRQRDRLRLVLPRTVDEVGTVGVDRMPDAGGLFGVTDFNDSTFR